MNADYNFDLSDINIAINNIRQTTIDIIEPDTVVYIS